jgi:hypothetical protein
LHFKNIRCTWNCILNKHLINLRVVNLLQLKSGSYNTSLKNFFKFKISCNFSMVCCFLSYVCKTRSQPKKKIVWEVLNIFRVLWWCVKCQLQLYEKIVVLFSKYDHKELKNISSDSKNSRISILATERINLKFGNEQALKNSKKIGHI